MAAPIEQMQELEQVCKTLLAVLAKSKAGEILQGNLKKQEQMIDKLLQTKKDTKQLIQELMSAEEKVAQKLADRDEQRKISLQKLQKIEDELLQARQKEAKLKTNTQELKKEFEELRKEIERREKEEAEDASVSLSAVYMSQLYYRICPIDWDFSCEQTLIKGIHYGPDIALPIKIESGAYSRCFISDYLWNLVPTSWGSTRCKAEKRPEEDVVKAAV